MIVSECVKSCVKLFICVCTGQTANVKKKVDEINQ